MRKLKALLATADDDWRVVFADELIGKGCDVHTASSGLEAIDLVRKHRYDLVVVDQSLDDDGEVELVFNLRDLSADMPIVVLSGAHVEQRQRIWQRCGVFFAGPRARAMRKMGEAVEAARARRVLGS